jgi:chemotaxis protein MotB
MATGRKRRSERTLDYWPGFVDALSTLLLVFVFLLTIFVVSQFFLTRELGGKEDALQQLNAQLAELTQILSLEKANSSHQLEELSALQASIAQLTQARDAALEAAEQAKGVAGLDSEKVTRLSGELDEQKQLSERALSQVEILNQQLLALRRQIAALEEALSASEAQNTDSQARITDLGARLNVALAQRVQELARYRSEFFGRLRSILANRPDIRVVGDRFVFQSEVFFDSARADLNPSALPELDKLAAALLQLAQEIPPEINWVMRVDGHTDTRPIRSPQYPSNWALSSARAIAVVEYLMSKGVSPQRLVAAGFGEYQPLDQGDNEEAYRRNRRIELKLTER